MLLKDYLEREKISYRIFAEQVGTHPQNMYRIVKAKSFPRHDLAKTIVEYTKGEVTLDDLYAGRPQHVRCPLCKKLSPFPMFEKNREKFCEMFLTGKSNSDNVTPMGKKMG